MVVGGAAGPVVAMSGPSDTVLALPPLQAAVSMRTPPQWLGVTSQVPAPTVPSQVTEWFAAHGYDALMRRAAAYSDDPLRGVARVEVRPPLPVYSLAPSSFDLATGKYGPPPEPAYQPTGHYCAVLDGDPAVAGMLLCMWNVTDIDSTPINHGAVDFIDSAVTNPAFPPPHEVTNIVTIAQGYFTVTNADEGTPTLLPLDDHARDVVLGTSTAAVPDAQREYGRQLAVGNIQVQAHPDLVGALGPLFGHTPASRMQEQQLVEDALRTVNRREVFVRIGWGVMSAAALVSAAALITAIVRQQRRRQANKAVRQGFTEAKNSANTK